MARVTQQKQSRRNAAAGSTRGAQVVKNRKTQKVVLESDSKGNKLRSVVRGTAATARGHAYPKFQISFRAEPPAGYTFIPAGNPQLTNALKDFARRENRKIHQVSTTPHASRHELSREVHRVGYHFPTDIVAKVCAHYGIRLTSGGRVINDNNNNDQIVMRVYQKGQLVLDEKVQDQVTINTDARETIKDLFPNIPDNDLFQIIKTAFQLGDGKVGTADEIPLVRRAQLSVVAHIRHTYTNYDKLLRRLPYNTARHQVEEETLKKLVEWRGNDDEKGDDSRRRAVDDLVREVIVVSDDEDSNSDDDEGEQIRQDELRVEELPSDAYGPPPQRASPSRDVMYEEATAGYRFVPQVPRRARLTDAEIDAQNRHRLAVWEQARQAYRSRILEHESQYERVYLGRASPPRTLIPLEPPAGSVIRREYLGPSPSQRPLDYEVRKFTEGLLNQRAIDTSGSSNVKNRTDFQQVLSPSRPLSPRYSGYTADGRRYQRITLDQPGNSTPLRRRTPPAGGPPSSSRPLHSHPSQYPQRRRSASPDVGRGSVLPSIESPSGPFAPSQGRQQAADHTRTWPTPPSNFTVSRDAYLRQPAIVDMSSSQESASNRRLVGSVADNPFQSHGDRPIFSENLQARYANQSPRPYAERRLLEVDQTRPGKGEPIFHPPAFPQRDVRYREVHELDQPGTRRILLPKDDLHYRRVESPGSNDVYSRPHPFEAQYFGSQTHQREPLPVPGQYVRVDDRARPPSPLRRNLEPLPSERYPAPYYSQESRAPMMEGRIVYTALPSNQVPARRFERLPESTFVPH